MKTIWRLCSARFSALDGEGARLYGGRYNHRGTALVYCAGTLSLAVLETLVHLNPGSLPSDFVAIKIEIDDGCIEHLAAGALPADWRTIPGPDTLKTLGSDWASRCTAVALAVPSAIVSEEDNYLLNPAHPDFARLVVHAPEPFSFDGRLQKEVAPVAPKRRTKASTGKKKAPASTAKRRKKGSLGAKKVIPKVPKRQRRNP